MPITGTLAADFSDFDKAVRVSSAELAKFEGGATKTAMAFTTLGGSLRDVDRIAALLGVSLGPLAAALSELSVIMASLNLAMGTLTPIGLVLAAAFATFKAAEYVRDYTQLDESIMELAEHTFEWGTASAQTQEQIDALRFASDYFGREITDLNLAMALQKQHTEEVIGAWRDLAEYEQVAADRSRELAKSFSERFRAASAERDKATREANAAALKRQTEFERADVALNDLANREIEARDKARRDYANWLGERYLEDDAARLAAEVAAHKQAADAIAAIEKTKYQDYLTITGAAGAGELERPQSLLRPQSLSQRGFVGFGEEGPTPAIEMPGVGGTTINNITMSGMLLSDDPAALDQFRTTLNRAVSPSMKQGRFYPTS